MCRGLSAFWGKKSYFAICGTEEGVCTRFVMLLRLMPRVERLCSMAEAAGCRMPSAPKRMRVELKLNTKR